MRSRPLREGERQLAWVWGVSSVVSLLLAPLWVKLAPLLPRCTFRHLTGFPCPTCGSTRAALALASGHPLEAFLWNPLVVILGALFVGGGLLAPAWSLLRLPVPVLSTGAWRAIRVVALLAILANWAHLVIRMR